MVEEKKKIDKKFRPTIYAFIALVGLSIAYYYIVNPMSQNQSGTREQYLFDFPSNKVNYISIKDSIDPTINCELKLNKNNVWEISGDNTYNQNVINILGFLKNVKVLDQIENYTALKDFGLFPPHKTLTLNFNDINVKPITIFVGSSTPTHTGRYIKYPDKNEVLIVENNFYNSLSVTPKSLLSRDMFNILPENMVSLAIKSKNKTIEVFKENNIWFASINKNKKFFADKDKIGFIAGNIMGNAANAVFKSTQTDSLKKYFKSPLYSIIIKDNKGHTASIDISDNIPGTKLHYVINNQSKKIFLLDNKKMKSLIFDDIDIKNKNLINQELDNIDKVKVKLNRGKQLVLSKNEDNTWQIEGNTMNDPALSAIYIEKLLGMKYDSVTLIDLQTRKDASFRNDAIGLSTTEVEMEINEKNNLPFVLRIGKIEKDGLHYAKNNYEPYLNCLSNNKVKEIISILNK